MGIGEGSILLPHTVHYNIPESETPKSKTSSGNVFTDIDILNDIWDILFQSTLKYSLTK